jgi:DNA-binding NarL/FixJ family response regulator
MNIEKNHQAIQVVLAEDHPYLRACVRQLLERDPTITVVGEATDGLETLDLVVRLQPDILILDRYRDAQHERPRGVAAP